MIPRRFNARASLESLKFLNQSPLGMIRIEPSVKSGRSDSCRDGSGWSMMQCINDDWWSVESSHASSSNSIFLGGSISRRQLGLVIRMSPKLWLEDNHRYPYRSQSEIWGWQSGSGTTRRPIFLWLVNVASRIQWSLSLSWTITRIPCANTYGETLAMPHQASGLARVADASRIVRTFSHDGT